MSNIIDDFVAKTRALNGKILRERDPWHTVVTVDTIRHFACGIADDNPLWLDGNYATQTHYGRLVAPPTFLTSVLYPILHGAPIAVPMSNLIGELEYQWFQPILDGDRLQPEAKQTGVYESRDRRDRRLVCIASETSYWNQNNALVGRANGTLIWKEQSPNELIADRAIYQYSESELAEIEAALQQETRTGNRLLFGEQIDIGYELPPLVRGPLTIGDLVCWQAAIGPSYRPGILGYKDGLKSPHSLVKNPVTGWSVKSSQQHEDFLLAKQRGMSAPFDNGVMRFAWLSPLLTNWMGDRGQLQQLRIRLLAPILYGDTTWYRGTVTQKIPTEKGITIRVKITGTNQLGEVNTEGEAEVVLPSRTEELPQTAPESIDLQAPIHFQYPDSECVFELIEAQVEKTPNAIALLSDNCALTYQETNQKANQLARYLRWRGVRPNDLVGICLDRSPDFIVCVLAVLKAGGAYLPLDADYPDDRLAFMLADSRSAFLMTNNAVDRFSIPDTIAVLKLNDLAADIAVYSTENLPSVNTANHYSYAVYTSGSTGQPKAVAPSHFSLVSYIKAAQKSLNISSRDRYLHSASFSFSAAVRQIFLPLSVGATLAIATTEQRRDPRLLFQAIAQHKITIWDTVPTFWKFCIDAFVDLESQARSQLLDNCLRLIMTTGEPLNWEIPRSWRDRLQQNTEIINLYSQSETTGTVSYYPIPQLCDNETGIVPLGRPFEDVEILLLDSENQCVEPGQVGELCVASYRLPQGYLHRPQLTAQKFLANPFNDGQKAPFLYKTGDLARYAADGNLEFVGRADRRVKIRGFRVELEEIETILTQHENIREAVAIARETATADKQIIAYVVPQDKHKVTIAQLRNFVGDRLPDYAIPASFILLEKLPRTPNGKLDRRSLPLPNLSRLGLESDFVAPRSELEEKLAAIWESVLDIHPVGIEDSFFELGGHSLLAVRLFSKIEQSFGRNLPLSLLFEAPTIAQLSKVLNRETNLESPSCLVAIRDRGSAPPLFCVHGIGGNILSYRKLVQYLPDDRPVYALYARGANTPTPQFATIEEMAADYLQEIKTVQPQGPYFLAAHSFGGKVIFEMAQQLQKQGEAVGLLALIDSSAPETEIVARSPHQEQQRKDRFMRQLPTWSRDPQIQPLVEVLYEAKRRYQARPYSGKIVFFMARETGDRKTLEFIDRWKKIALEGVEVCEVDGDHWTMLEDPHVRDLAQQLSRYLRSQIR